MSKRKRPLQIFISYSHHDIRYKDELLKCLKPFERTYNITTWHDGKILAGQDIDQSVLQELESSDIILLLVSSDFISSCYCIDIELKKAIERYERNECIVVPIVVSECHIDNSLSFARLKTLPHDRKPIQSYKPQNKGYKNVVEELDILIKDCLFNSKPNKKRQSVSKNKSESFSFNLYQDGVNLPYAINKQDWVAIVDVKNRLVSFDKIITQKLIESIEQYRIGFQKCNHDEQDRFRERRFKLLIFDLCLSIKEWIFKNVGVRIHFRVLNESKNQYDGYMMVDSQNNGDVDLSLSLSNQLQDLQNLLLSTSLHLQLHNNNNMFYIYLQLLYSNHNQVHYSL